MIANKTYNNVIDTLKQLGIEHDQITTTTTGDIYDIDLSKNTLFPLFHINPVNVSTSPSELTYNFQLFVMDLVSQKDNWTAANLLSATNLSNEQEVLSQTLQICVDIIGMMRHSKWQAAGALDIDDIVYFTEGEFTIEPFTERFDNLLTGWAFSIGIVVQNDFQTCVIPVQDNPIGK
jgi:hypothetical protein|tara:strand:+ start:654 stop:1184 length:531 start_codon:yes stop_codon:yes gene_type:complete